MAETSTSSTEPKLDRRKQRTRQLLRDSLMTLMLERAYEDISVQDITDRANLGRATFYLHYRDKEELLLSSFQAIYEDLSRSIINVPTPELAQANTFGLIAFKHAQENQQLYRVMLTGQGSIRIERGIHHLLIDLIRTRLDNDLPKDLPIPREIIANHIVGALVSLIAWWLENNLPYSVEQMALMFRQLTIKSLATRFFPDVQKP